MGQSQMMGFANYGIQVSTQDMEDVDLYMQTSVYLHDGT